MRMAHVGWVALASLGLLTATACSSCSKSGKSDGESTASEPASGAKVRSAPCPSGLGEHWVCDGLKRIKCLDGALQSEACEGGCTDPAGEVTGAVCNCIKANSSRWNCTPDGQLHSCNGAGWISADCGGKGCTAAPSGTSDTCNPSALALQTVLDKLGPQCGQFSPGTDCGLTVRDLTTGETASYRGNAFYASASSVKALWVAAALLDVGVEKVRPYANPIFIDSDNSASGTVIDLLVSPDRVNTFTWHDVGVVDIGFCHWNYDHDRNATNCPKGPRGGNNFITTNDAVGFLSAIWSKRVLGAAKTQQLLDWMKLSPRQGYGGWLGTQLPEAARATMHHKAGWLPPVEAPENSNSNEIGIVEIPGGHAYAVALLLNGAPSQEAYDQKQLPTLEYASCVIYHAVANDQPDPFGGACHHL